MSLLTGGAQAYQIAQTDILLCNKTPQPTNTAEVPCCCITQLILQDVTGLTVILQYCAVVPLQDCFCHAIAHYNAQQCIK